LYLPVSKIHVYIVVSLLYKLETECQQVFVYRNDVLESRVYTINSENKVTGYYYLKRPCLV